MNKLSVGSMPQPNAARAAATRITLLGMLLDTALGVAKIVGGLMTSSFALVTDGVHSLTDAATDIFVLIIARTAYAAPDRGHPYGHGRFEAIGTLVLGIVFFATAGVLIYDALLRLQTLDSLAIPALSGAAVAALSIAAKEWIARLTLAVAERLNSSLLRANAWHSRSDALSSVAVLIGIIGAQFGLAWMDIAAALVVALMIAKIGWELCLESFTELVDGALPDERRDAFERCLCETPGVESITDLRSRLSGGRAIVEVHLVVSPKISVSEGHQIGVFASQRLREAFDDISEVIPHIDPRGNAEHALDSASMTRSPTRAEVAETLAVLRATKRLNKEQRDSTDLEFVLHYRKQGIEIDLIGDRASSDAELESLAAELEREDFVITVRVLKQQF